MKPATYIFRAILLLVLTLFLGYISSDLLTSKVKDTDVPVDAERFVVPIKKNILKKVLSEIGTVTTVSDGMKLSIPSSSRDKIAADKISGSARSYGISIDNDGQTTVLQMSSGPSSTILVPVPTVVALVDRGLLKYSK